MISDVWDADRHRDRCESGEWTTALLTWHYHRHRFAWFAWVAIDLY